MVSALGLSLAEVFCSEERVPSSNCRHAMRTNGFFCEFGRLD